jgi:hypothetical protein
MEFSSYSFIPSTNNTSYYPMAFTFKHKQKTVQYSFRHIHITTWRDLVAVYFDLLRLSYVIFHKKWSSLLGTGVNLLNSATI